jgi:DNA-binding NarL/FixJ family response regulator
MSPLRILIADNHEVVRAGIRSLLETRPGWEVCAEVASGREAVQEAKKCKPDVAILDIVMPDLNGLDAARQILKTLPDTQVLILTMHQSEELANEAFEAGARGYMLKSDAGAELVIAVEALRKHKLYFTSKVADMVLQSYIERGPGTNGAALPGTHLSQREREILQVLAEGKSNKEAATALDISVKTVETHRANVMRKLSLHSLSDLTRYAIRNKLIVP